MARKRGMQYIPYDYEAAYNKAMEDMHEWFIENLFQHRKKVIYALKEITAGDQFEIEIYPQFRSMDEVPPEGRTIKKDNNKAQKNLNDKNARKYVERLINENFSDRDIWMTLTYDDEHLPPDGDVDAAIKNVQKYIRRINYQRKKRGLPNAKYVYVTAYNPDAEIRWHHHIVMDGALDMETVESCWKQSMVIDFPSRSSMFMNFSAMLSITAFFSFLVIFQHLLGFAQSLFLCSFRNNLQAVFPKCDTSKLRTSAPPFLSGVFPAALLPSRIAVTH